MSSNNASLLFAILKQTFHLRTNANFEYELSLHHAKFIRLEFFPFKIEVQQLESLDFGFIFHIFECFLPIVYFFIFRLLDVFKE
jgi:hypothetical protein